MKYNPEEIYKGAVFSPEKLEQITETPASHKNFNVKCLQFKSILEQEMQKKGVEKPAIKQINGCLMILPDTISHHYGASITRAGVRKIEKGYNIVKSADPRSLDEEEKQAWHKNLEVTSRVYQSVIPHVRSVMITHTERRAPVVSIKSKAKKLSI